MKQQVARTAGVAFALSAFFAHTGHGQSSAEVTQQAVAQRLLSDSRQEQIDALAIARGIAPGETGDALRAALIEVLARETATRLKRDQAALRGEMLEPIANDFYAGVTESVVALKDTRAIPALSGALGTGLMVIRALAEHGEAAAPTVLAVVSDVKSLPPRVGNGLITLRLMLEGSSRKPLTAGTIDQMRTAARDRLTGRQAVTTLTCALELAAALGDPGLWPIMESLATDQREVRARGVQDLNLVEQLQERAAAALAKARRQAPAPAPPV